MYEGTPKTRDSVRTIKLPEETMALLEEYRQWQEAQRQELQAKGLLDFDEPADEADTEPADDDFWTEDSDAEATPDGDASSDETDA